MSDEPDNSVKCPECNGQGWKPTRNPHVLVRGYHEVPCQKCRATGWVAPSEPDAFDAWMEPFVEGEGDE